MELVLEVGGAQLKVFVAALQCLSQVGKDLCLEVTLSTSTVLTCCVLNDAHSASAQITFERSFFDHVRISTTPFNENIPFVRCKVFAKACCNVFRSLKHVQRLQLGFIIDPDTLRHGVHEHEIECEEIRWKLHCDYEITKTHRMKVHASTMLRAVVDRNLCPSRLTTRPLHLASLLAHIHHSYEVAITCGVNRVKLESYFSAVTDSKAYLHTETAVESEEFQDYHLDTTREEETGQLIFGLKELRALLSFCKTSDLGELTFYFSSAGSPVLFAAESTGAVKFAIEVTLSTVTTFLPATSQTQSEDGITTVNNAVACDLEPRTNEEDPRYLTHNKRMRVD